MRKLTISMLVFALLVVPLGVSAQSDDETMEIQITNIQEETTSRTVRDPSQLREAVTQRLADKRQEIADRLTANRERLLENKCQAAQNRMQGILTAGESIYEAREGIYNRILETSNSIIARLTATSEVDLTELSGVNEQLQTEVQSYLSDFELYLGSLEIAIADQDCSQDPTDFHTNLESARELRSELRDKAQEIRNLMSGSFRAALQDVREQLSSQPELDEPIEAETSETGEDS